jgi:hypothetical protein
VIADAYERAEREYLDAVASGATPAELAAAARDVRKAAHGWQSAAYAEFFAERAIGGDADRTVIEKEIDAEKAELLSELWYDIASAHAGATPG